MKLNKLFTLTIISILYLTSCGKSGGYAPSSDLASVVTPTPEPTPTPTPTTAPGSLIITNPSILSATTNTALTIAGQCENGATVYIEGDSTQSVACALGVFSFSVTKTTNGTYFFNLYQSNAYGSSDTISVSWLFDDNPPAAIIISSPALNPYSSGDSSISIAGSCETSTTVNITGDHTASTTCAAGSFIFTGIAKGVDASYVFNLTQTDSATNVSAATTFTWIRDTTIPATPTISNFADNPHYTNTSPLTVTGVCITGNTVNIDEGGVNLATMVCAGNSYSLNVAKGLNGTYTLVVYQIDAISLNPSANRDFTWIYDSVAPAAPTINSPSASPVTSSGTLTISGQCEINATVNLTGDDTQNQLCTAGSFSFDITESIDGVYNYTLTQTDLAANTSAGAAQQWIKDSTALPLPTIDTPATDPFISNSTNLILSGTCQTGLTVQLGGVLAADVLTPSNSLTTTCAGSSYSFTILKPDGTYALSIYQTDGVTNSGTVTRTWTKDTVEPNTTLSSSPVNPNYSNLASFVFSSNESGSTECSLDGAAYATCVSPLTYVDLANTSHTLNIRSIDTANNVESTPASHTWTQEASKAIALYHFDAAAPMLDSSNYSGGSSNTLTDNASANLASAKFAEGRTMATTANYAYVADNPSQQAIASYLTLEAQVQLTGLPGSYAPIISKINTSAPTKESFEYGIRKQGAKYYIYFRGSLNGTSYTEVRSTSLSGAEETALTASFNHIAVTWSLGSIKFYFNGVSKGSGSIGTVGSAKLASSAAAMRIGYNGTTALNGSVDEVRVSQVVRWPTSFTPPVSAYTAD